MDRDRSRLARGPQGAASRICGLAAALLALASPAALITPAPANAAEPIDLTGTWFLVIHYTDESTANPDAARWLDRVWIFAPKGSRLQWSEYPIVVVNDTSGRFEAISGNSRSRVLAAWNPSTTQLNEIVSGPRVNQRGSKEKSLRRTKQGNWASQSRSAVRSASVVSYTETWTIDDPTGLPRFAILDTLGGAGVQSDGGGSTYEVTEILENGELRGLYQRDGIKHGTFRMLRTAPVRGLVTSEDGKTANQRASERAAERWIEEAQQPDEE